MAKAKHIVIENEVINLENIDYINKRTGKKSQEDETPVHIISIVMNSGVQVAIPFEHENTCDYVHKRIIDELGAVRMAIPEMKKA